MNFAQFLLVPVCVSMWGFSYLVMKHFTRSPGILHLKYYLILLRSSGYVTQPCVSWYPIPLLDPARYQVSHFSLRATHWHTNTCREQRGDIVQFAHPVWEYRCYVCPPQLFLYCHKQTYAYSNFCFNIQNNLQTPFKSKTSWRGGKTAENDLWRVVDPSQAASVRCFRSNTILTVLLFLAIW